MESEAREADLLKEECKVSGASSEGIRADEAAASSTRSDYD